MIRRSRFIPIAVLLIAVVSILYLSVSHKQPIETERKAAIVDGLSEDFPRPKFIGEVVNLLKGGGYRVEVYNSSSLTVEFYEGLPSMGYELILMRVHSAPMDNGSKPGAAMFTCERPPGRYMTEMFLGWVKIARTLTRGERFYAVTPAFIEESMEGDFDHTVIFLMSCYGFVDDTLAKIFIEKGASTFVGWTEKVAPDHMDKAALILLEKMMVEEFSIADAVRYTMEEVGADPTYGGKLEFYTENMGS